MAISAGEDRAVRPDLPLRLISVVSSDRSSATSIKIIALSSDCQCSLSIHSLIEGQFEKEFLCRLMDERYSIVHNPHKWAKDPL